MFSILLVSPLQVPWLISLHLWGVTLVFSLDLFPLSNCRISLLNTRRHWAVSTPEHLGESLGCVCASGKTQMGSPLTPSFVEIHGTPLSETEAKKLNVFDFCLALVFVLQLWASYAGYRAIHKTPEFSNFIVFHYFMYMNALLGIQVGQKKASGCLELELQVDASHRVGAGNQTYIFWKNRQCSYLLNHLSITPKFGICKNQKKKQRTTSMLDLIFFFLPRGSQSSDIL